MIRSPMRTPTKGKGSKTRESTAVKGSAHKKYHGTNFEKITLANMEVDGEFIGKRNIAVYNEAECKNLKFSKFQFFIFCCELARMVSNLD